MENNDVKNLIETFKAYRELLTPIQGNLQDFADTYGQLRSDIEKLNTAFDGDAQSNLDKIYKTLSKQAESATDLSSRIDRFISQTNKYSGDISRMVTVFESVEGKIKALNAIEEAAEAQIAKLDALMEEKKKSYNVKELSRTLDNYNANVQKVSEFINKDVADILSENQRTLESIKQKNEALAENLKEEGKTVKSLLETFSATADIIKRIGEKQDVNEAYIFDILDKWAESRKVRIKK